MAQRLSTFYFRCTLGFCGGCLLHLSVDNYWWLGFLLHLLSLITTVLVCWLVEDEAEGNDAKAKAKAERYSFVQKIIIAVGFFTIAGGVVRWVA